MEKYHKINNVFLRDSNNKNKLIEGRWARPEFELLKDITWVGTEKVDGTNIRVIWDGERVKFRGKTDHAQLPTILYDKLNSIFNKEEIIKEFENTFENTPACLYGEGYGKKIQNGHNYIKEDVDFILFDILINDYWLTPSTMIDIANILDIKYMEEIEDVE